MLWAPAVACEISAPPTTPRGTSRSAAGLTTFTAGSLRWTAASDVETVVEPLRPAGGRARRDAPPAAGGAGRGAPPPPPPPAPAPRARRGGGRAQRRPPSRG